MKSSMILIFVAIAAVIYFVFAKGIGGTQAPPYIPPGAIYG